MHLKSLILITLSLYDRLLLLHLVLYALSFLPPLHCFLLTTTCHGLSKELCIFSGCVGHENITQTVEDTGLDITVFVSNEYTISQFVIIPMLLFQQKHFPK